MSEAHQRAIYERIDELSGYETVPAFSQAFYELIADLLSGSDGPSASVRDLYLQYLSIESRYHGALSAAAATRQLTATGLQDATEKRDIGLRSLLEFINGSAVAGTAEVGRALLAAECYYHLGLTDLVVERLERAIAQGADHPLAHFALGYNRYQLANQTFTTEDVEEGDRQVVDEDRFRLACLSAVSAFQEGLADDDFDGQLHWWIGTVLRAAGFSEAADASMRRAAEVLSDSWILDIDDVDADDPWTADDAVGGFGPITDNEIDEAADFLRGSFQRADLN